MYPQPELNRLAAYKAALRRDIAFRRAECGRAAARVTAPLAWLDRVAAFWRRLPPLAQFVAAPLVSLVQRAVLPRQKLLGALLRWGPLVLGAVRGFSAAGKSRPHPAGSADGQH